MGISVDSRHSHSNWAADLGGVSYPLLADFHPKGEVARSYGVYLEDAGISDRATIIIDRAGVVRYASSVTPSGQRDIDQLLRIAREIDATQPGPAERPGARGRLSTDATLYVREGCRFCQAVLRAAQNLHCGDALRIRDVNKDPGAREELERLVGPGAKVPVLVQDGQAQRESADIIKSMAKLFARCWRA